MPATVNSGDLLLLLYPYVGGSVPSGWNRYDDFNAPVVYYRVADGTEAGGTVSITPSSSSWLMAFVVRITGADVNNLAAAVAYLDDPPAVFPPGGVNDYLWLVLGAVYNPSVMPNMTGYPTGYGNLTEINNGASAEWALLYKQSTAASDDPSAFTAAAHASNLLVSLTVAVGPAPGPAIVTRSPIHGAVGVLPDALLRLDFDKTIAIGAGQVVLRNARNSSVIEQISISDPRVTFGSNYLTIDFATAFDAAVPGYAVTIPKSAVLDSSGNEFDGLTGHEWVFTARSGGHVIAPRLLVVN